MGSELGMFSEWKDLEQVDWHLQQFPMHRAMQCYVRELNHFYRSQSALWEQDQQAEGFAWISPHDHEQSVISFIRQGKKSSDQLLVIINFTPAVRHSYRIGASLVGMYQELFNSDEERYGGSGVLNSQRMRTEPIEWHDRPNSLTLTVPPLGIVILQRIK
jgi:1,4-alpha-glucan branching enzyme